MRTFLRTAIGVALVSGLVVIAKENFEEAGRRWWSHVHFLASDNLQGRATGSTGFDLAADYVAQQFQRARLRPGGIDNFFQPVSLIQLTLDESESSIELLNGEKATPAILGDDAILGINPSAAATLEAPLVFVGYGLKIPEANWDDLGGQSLTGAVAVYLSGGPAGIAGNLRSHYSSTAQRWAAMMRAGAIGMLSIPNPKEMEVPWKRIAQNRAIPRMTLADPVMQETVGEQFSGVWNPDKAQMLFAGSNVSFAEVLAAANANRPLPHSRLATKLKAKTIFKQEPVVSKNVVGIRWGSDPKLTHEFVVLSAHLDHLGEGPIGEPDRIYNGAMDNAAGVASLIEIAHQLQQKKIQTKRSLLFLALTAEEKGELGSRYYASDPSVDGKYVADINMDMFLPLIPLKYLEVQGLNESTLGDDIRAVCSNEGVDVQADMEPNKNRFIRSDQYSFVKHGVPALAFKFGYLSGSPEEKIFQTWYSQRYHDVKDDLDQPVDAAAAAKLDRILLKLSERIANADHAPSWKPESFFKRFAK